VHASADNITTTIYVSRSLKRALEEEAARDGRSVSGLVRLVCSRYLADVATPLNAEGAPKAPPTIHERISNEHPNGSG
jgi:hypothetical protein